MRWGLVTEGMQSSLAVMHRWSIAYGVILGEELSVLSWFSLRMDETDLCNAFDEFQQVSWHDVRIPRSFPRASRCAGLLN